MALFESVEQNLLALFRHFAIARDSGEIREMQGVSIASSGLRFHLFNTAFLSEPVTAGVTELERRLLTAAVHFKARGLRWAYWICEDKLGRQARQKAGAVFRRNGLTLVLQHPGMMAEYVPPPQRPLTRLEIRRLEGEHDRMVFCHINAVAFGLPMVWCREVFDLASLWQTDLVGFIGYASGDPVSTAAVFPAAGVAGIYCVATLPGHRGKGYAEAIVRHALIHAREQWGIERTILQSSPQAVSLYRRIGYETVTQFLVYSA